MPGKNVGLFHTQHIPQNTAAHTGEYGQKQYQKGQQTHVIVRLGDDEEAARENAMQFFRDNPALESLSAVKNNKVIFLDKRMYNMKPNGLWAEAYLQLEGILFED